MLSCCGISVWIEVDGKELEQYGVEEDPDLKQVTCWIPTQEGKAFSVVFKDDVAYREYSLCSALELDGTRIAGKVNQPLGFGPGTPPKIRTVTQNNQASSATTARPFIFSKLELTDDDEYLNHSSTHLGEIRINIHGVQVGETRLCEPRPTTSGHSKVHERSKKAVTHCVSFGQDVRTGPQYACHVRYLDGLNPLATFIFRYRDAGLLQANGIMPKPVPAQNKAVAHGEVLDLTTADDPDVKREPINQEIEIVDHATQRKPSKRSNLGSESGSQLTKRIKREKVYVSAGEVIDLT